jgi:hypothetical protein
VDPVQFYETTVADRDSGLAAGIVVIPSKSFRPEPLDRNLAAEVLADLGVELHVPFDEFEVLPPTSVVGVAVAGALVGEAWLDKRELSPPQWVYETERGQRLSSFTDYVMLAEVLPFEQSPLRAASLASLMATGGLVTVGAGAGLAATGAFGGTPLVLVTVPLGIILVGAAKGVATALEQGLRSQILQLMGVSSDEERTEDTSPSGA